MNGRLLATEEAEEVVVAAVVVVEVADDTEIRRRQALATVKHRNNLKKNSIWTISTMI